ncbi:MAG: rRNA maturation RNase YbeY [Gemmatimonadetes bacterium]|nr:rRNA maturation RNase YbeY [Gemmatimonadota bacterium]MDE3256750.1 rRNA maturation RNase YbeY [Gemmatimonadota bacterium]
MTRVRIEQEAPLPEACDTIDLEFLLDSVLEDHCAEGTVTLVLARDATLRRLNGQFKGAFVPTDVLSFDLADPVHPDCEDLGEIYISVDRAALQAREGSRCVSEELAWLAIHGTLHLLGYRHDCARSGASMRRKEREYLARHHAGIHMKGV